MPEHTNKDFRVPLLAQAGRAQPLTRARRVQFSSTAMAALQDGSGGGGQRAVLWFRNDLRLHDNAIVAEAAQRVKSGQMSEVRLARPQE